MEVLGLLESETFIIKGAIIFLLAMVIKAFILYLISGRTNSSILSPIGWEQGWGLGSALTW